MIFDLLQQAKEVRWFAVSKKHFENVEAVKRIYGDSTVVKDGGGDDWLINAESKLHKAATQQEIRAIEELYAATLPDDYKSFLLQSNGADLFIHARANRENACECTILSTEDILGLHAMFVETIESLTGLIVDHLFYIPVADVTDGSFTALSTHPAFPNEMFQLYQDSAYLPYTPENRGSHYPKLYSSSFAEWLRRVLQTHGAFGIDP